jgi:hypothetical protein
LEKFIPKIKRGGRGEHGGKHPAVDPDETSSTLIFHPDTNRPMKIHCHCEERSDEAIQLDHHGALRAPRDDNSVKGKGDWYERSEAPVRRVLYHARTTGFFSRDCGIRMTGNEHLPGLKHFLVSGPLHPPR